MGGRKNIRYDFIVKNIFNSVLENIALKTRLNVARPSVVYLGMSRKCCARCVMCTCWEEADRTTDLSFDLASKIILGLREWLGTCLIQCGGGEPFMNKDFLKIAGFAVKNKLLVGAVTNALLINEEKASEIMNTGFFNINISVDGIKHETHDYLRGINGAHERVEKAIRYLLRFKKEYGSGTKIIIKPIIMGYNIKELIDLVKYYGSLEGITGINFQPLSDTNDAAKKLWVSDINELDRFADELSALKKEGYPILNSYSNIMNLKSYFRKIHDPDKNPCTLGYRNIFIDQYGDVALCGNGFPSIGNAGEADIKDIYNSKKAEEQRNAILRCRKFCLGTCHVKKDIRDKIDMFKNFVVRS